MIGNKLSDTDPAAARDFFQSVIDTVDSVIYTVDRELRVIGVNQQWNVFALENGREELTQENIVGTHLLKQMRGKPLERWQRVCRQILSGEIPRYLDEIACEEQFAWRHYSLTANPLQNSQGEILGITFVATNITQLKRAEAEMLQRLVEIRGLRQMAQTAGAGFVQRRFYKQVTRDIAHIFDAEKCIIFRWDEVSGYLQAQIPAFGLAERRLLDLDMDIGEPADPASLWQDLEEEDYILLNEGDYPPPNIVKVSCGANRLAAMMAVLRVSGRVHGTILVASRDHPFSEQEAQLLAAFAVPVVLAIEDAELNQRLLNRSRQLAATREELDRMLNVAESIRAPLTVLRGYLELLCDGALGSVPNGQAAIMNILRDRARDVTGLVERLAPMQFLFDAVHYELLHLSELVRRVIDRWRPAIEQAGLKLVTQLPKANDRECMTTGNPELLINVFDALLDNAIKFSPNGGKLHISLHESNEIVFVKITDPGVGIPTPQLLQIWRPKKQVGRSGSIGLLEVKQIIEEHGGQVWVESLQNQGSTFYVTLPRITS